MTADADLKLTVKERLFIESPSEELRSRIIKDNTFANPKYEANAQHGYSNWQTKETIETFKNLNGGVSLPRGYARDLIAIFHEEGISISIEDLRVTRPVEFPPLRATLRPYQEQAVEKALQSSQGVIVAPTGSGKTLIGLEIIRQRQQKTLIIVHRSDLAQQWADVILDRLGLKASFISNGRFAVGDKITIAMIQTLSSKADEAKKLGDEFGLVLVDEVHHIPAETFSEVIGWMSAKYLYGLSATLERRDGLEPMIYRGIGPAIATISKAEVEELGAIVPLAVTAMNTGFDPGSVSSWSEYLDTLTTATERNQLIIDLAIKAADPVLILVDRVAHAEQLSEMLSQRNVDHVLAHGQLKADERSSAMDRIKTAQLTIGTTSLLGEGLDVSAWSVLILASPISSEIKLKQALGRIVRPAVGKERGIVYDLKDDCGFAGHSFKSRFEIYKKNKIWVNF
jgi:superfamily II DNA or RNA helicase